MATRIAIPARRPADVKIEPVVAAGTTPRWGFPEVFVICQTLFPALLLLPGSQAIRLPLRIAPFALSLAALGWWLGHLGKGQSLHPAAHWLIAAIFWLAIMIFHPTTNTTTAGLAQTMLYLAVMAPVFWAPMLVRNEQQLVRLLAIILVCNAVNSLVGILQVYDPATWMPAELSSVQKAFKYGLSTVTYVDRNGQVAIRPPGLSDTPGAVGTAGMIAGLTGLAFGLRRMRAAWRVLALIGAAIGCAVVYLSQVRTSLLVLIGMIVIYVLVVGAVRKQKLKAIYTLILAAGVLTVAFWTSIPLAGTLVAERVDTLRQGDPLSVYYKAGRGTQIENAVTTLAPAYPLGAGLGRWGMMRFYFGDESNPDSPLIWAELQVPTWLLDGGVVLVLLYGVALFVTSLFELRVARQATTKGLQFCGPLVLAANIGVVAIVFGYTPFTAPLGIQYWFLAGALGGVAQASGLFENERSRSRKRRLHGLGRNGSGELRAGPTPG